MASSFNIWKLAIAELAIFILLLPIVVYVLVRHGKHGIEGWGFLAVFCILRLISSGLQIGDQNAVSSTGSIINSIGISGLLLAFSGVLHEVERSDALHDPKLGLILSLVVHVMVVTGIVLAAIGGFNLARPEDQDNDNSKNHNLQKGGYVVLLIAVLLLLVYNIILLFRLRSQQTQRKSSSMRLLRFTLAALLFGIVRVAYGLASAVSTSPDISPVTGTFAVKFVLIFLVQLIATVLLIIGGLKSTDFWQQPRHPDTGSVQFEH